MGLSCYVLNGQDTPSPSLEKNPVETALEHKVEKLIVQLSSPDYLVREQAMRELIRLGLPIEALLLEQIKIHPPQDFETLMRIQMVFKRIHFTSLLPEELRPQADRLFNLFRQKLSLEEEWKIRDIYKQRQTLSEGESSFFQIVSDWINPEAKKVIDLLQQSRAVEALHEIITVSQNNVVVRLYTFEVLEMLGISGRKNGDRKKVIKIFRSLLKNPEPLLREKAAGALHLLI